MRPRFAALALLLSVSSAASATLTPAQRAQVVDLKKQIAASKFAPPLVRQLTTAADEIEDTASLNAVQVAFQTCHYGGEMPAKFYQAKLAALQPRIAALGDTAYAMEPKLSVVKAEIQQQPIPIDQIVAVDADWHDLANNKIASAEAQAKSNAALQATFHAKIAALETAFLSLPRHEAAEFQIYEKAQLLPKESCNGRCDAAWRKAIAAAIPDVDRLQASAANIIGICANIKSQVDPVKAKMPQVAPAAAAKIQPLLDAVYAALAAGPYADAQKALAALNNLHVAPSDMSGNSQAPAAALTTAPGAAPTAPVDNQPSAGALTTAPPTQ